MVDPEKAKEVARNIKQKLHRIQKNIVELKQVGSCLVLCKIKRVCWSADPLPKHHFILGYVVSLVNSRQAPFCLPYLQVARSIVQTYIYNGAEFQLNLPGAVRTRTEEKFKAWATTLLASVTRDALGKDKSYFQY